MKHKIGFSKGLNKDISPDKYDSENYWDAMNIQIMSDTEHGGYAVSQELGLGTLFLFPTGHELLGWTTMRNYLICFTGKKSTADYLYIWLLEFEGSIDKIKKSSTPGDYITYMDTLSTSYHLKYSADLNINFSDSNELKIDCLAKYINSTYGKVYWTDFNNPLRSINILDPLVASTDSGLLDVIPDIELTNPKYNVTSTTSTEVLPGGIIPSGMVQYCYQLFNRTGVYSAISSMTALLQLTSVSHAVADPHDYIGDSLSTSSNKKISINITNTDSNYEYIRIIGIYYTDSTNIPSVKVVKEAINPKTGTLIVVDNGSNYLETLTIESLIGSSNLFTCKTLAVKDKRLCAGNIEETFFEVDYDTRTYRFEYITPSPRLYARIQNVDGTEAITSDPILYLGGAWNYDRAWFDTIMNGGESIPEEHDCFIGYNSLYDATANNTNNPLYFYKWMLYDNGDGTWTRRLGGMGKNIDYWFTIDPIIMLDNDVNSEEYLSSKGNYNYDSWYPNASRVSDAYDDWINYKCYTNSGCFRGYQRDEIYRFGIVFINGKGQRSYVSWIGDIKMPAIWEEDAIETITGIYTFPTAIWDNTYSELKGCTLSINFKLYNIPIDPITGVEYRYQIVRVIRNQSDQSIHSQGVCRTLQDVGTAMTEWYMDFPINATPAGQTYAKYFTSPEICFLGSNLNDLTSYYLDNQYTFYETGDTVYGVNNLQKMGEETSISSPIEAYVYKGRTWDRMYNTVTPGFEKPLTEATHKVETILDSFIADQEVDTLTESLSGPSGGYTILMNINEFDPTNMYGKVAFITTNMLQRHDDSISCVSNLKTININQYGGSTYIARQNNEYIICTGILNGENSRKQVFGGDIYICYFSWLMAVNRGLLGATYASNVQIVGLYPIETRYNLDMQHGDFWPYLKEVYLSGYAGSSYAPTTQTKDYYLYNSVYSREEDVIKYYAKPVLFEEQQHIDTQIKISDQAIGSELIDSWLSFQTNNISEVDTEYGAINKLLTWKDKLYFFQDIGFGIQALNERALMRTETGEELVMGSGNIVGDYGYISTNYGTKFMRSVLGTESSIYFIDSLSKALVSYNMSQQIPINKIKGLNSYFNNYLNGDITVEDYGNLDIDINSGFDKENNRIYYTIKNSYTITVPTTSNYFLLYTGYAYKMDLIKEGSIWYYGTTPITITSINTSYSPVRIYFTGATITNAYTKLTIPLQFTISYNELLNIFESFHDYLPDFYVSVQDKLLQHTRNAVSGGASGTRLTSVHNAGLPNRTSYITILSNQYPDLIKTFTNLEYDLSTKYLDKDIYDSNLSSIQVYNDYQNTNEITLTSNNSKRRMRTWRYTIPRSIAMTTGDRTDARIRDYYSKIKFKFITNKIQKLRNVIVKFLP